MFQSLTHSEQQRSKKFSSIVSLFRIYLCNESSKKSTKQQKNINVSEITTTKKIYHWCLHRNHQSLINVPPKNHQKRLINQALMKYQKLKNSTLKSLLIKHVCVQIFVVSSMVLQRVINESSMKKQWNIIDSDVNTTKTMRIKKVAIEKITIRKTSLQRNISDRRGSSNETSMFRRLCLWKHLWSSMFASKFSL